MLKEQLQELQKTRRTILTTPKDKITFIEDETIDSNALFHLLEFPSAYTTPKSLKFDRHRLSEKEEKKFNKDFSQYLRGLISSMKHPQIDLVLEFLLRTYNLNQFNQSELIFLLLPFPKYFKQLNAIQMKNSNPIEHLKSYSYSLIAQLILKDDYLMLNFVEYSKNYNVVKEFVDRIFLEFSEKNSDILLENIDSFYQILKNLIDLGNKTAALKILKNIKEFQNFSEITELFDEKELETELNSTKRICISKYQTIYESAKGREFLNNIFELSKYLEFLKFEKLNPKEFNSNEFKMLLNIFFKENNEIENLGELKDLLCFNSIKSEIFKYFNEKNIPFTDPNQFEFSIEKLNNENYREIVLNLPSDVLQTNSIEILFKCLGFKLFDNQLFLKNVFKNELPTAVKEKIHDFFKSLKKQSELISNEIICNFKNNSLKLLEESNIDFSKELFDLSLSCDPICLSYILQSKFDFKTTQISKIQSDALLNHSPLIITDLINFICRNKMRLSKKFSIEGFYQWAVEKNYISNLKPFMNTFFKNLSATAHFNFMVATKSIDFFNVLLEIQPSLIQDLYNGNHFDILLAIANEFSIGNILIENNKVLEILNIYKSDKTEENDLICKYLLDNSKNSNAIPLLLNYLDQLIAYRTHSAWNIAKAVLLEGLNNKQQYEITCNYILENINLFDESDSDLFELVILNYKAIDVLKFKKLTNSNVSAIFIELYLQNNDTDVLPVLPAISPILIDHKKESISILFDRYSNIMVSYSKKLIQKFVEKSSLLVQLDPRITLREICNNFNSDLANTFSKILETQVCRSETILQKIVECFEINFGTILDKSHLLKFIKFYKKSFDSEQDILIAVFLLNILEEDTTLFFSFALEALEISNSIFYEVVLRLSDIIQSGELTENVAEVIEFLCSYLEKENIEFSDSNELFNVVYNLEIDNSAKLCSYLIRNDEQILSEKIEMVLADLINSNKIQKALDTLIAIFKNVENSSEFKRKILPHAIVLSEDRNNEISNKAYELIEFIQ